MLAAATTGTASSAPKPPFKVTSTLDGKTVLPHRIRWLAHPRLPVVKVKEVDFLIDGGKPRWIEHNPPYTYSDDEGGGLHEGYLVTSWLTPGMHRFTVRVITTDRRTVSHTVAARVLPAAEPPAGLAGTWQRTIADAGGAPAPGSAGNPTETLTPPGTYTMVIEKRWIQVRFPGAFRRPQSDTTGEGWILDSDYAAGPGTLRVLGPVIFDTFHEQAETGWWCYQDGPESDYTWSTTGDTLTLKPAAGADRCGVRGFIWSGDWKRVA
ncbi:MAG TPA: hypothetical protein VFB35_08260 [Gaiellaceae bacterium]|nr:hypothetical protein [Gaiellaceae bacterium]